jgi:hypothetical protein
MRRLVQSAAVVAVMTTTAAAQPAPPPAVSESPGRRWSVSAGYEVFSLRDISRNIRPPDASPISWRGAGPAVIGRYDIERGRASHLIEVAAARAGNFSYAGPSGSAPALASDLAGHFSAGYEYRRYLWRDLLIDGLDAGVGAQGLATRVGFDRHITNALVTKTRISGGGGAGVLAIRWRRSDRLRVEASWANGAVVSNRSTRHSAQTSDETHSGGNWLTHSTVRFDWRLSETTRLTAAWRRDYDGYASSHYSYGSYRQRLEFGAAYGR